MATYFPSQASSNLTIVSFGQSLSVRHVNFISFKVIRFNVEIFCALEVRSEVTNNLVTRDNILHRKRIYLQKDESSIFKHNVKVFRNSPIIK